MRKEYQIKKPTLASKEEEITQSFNDNSSKRKEKTKDKPKKKKKKTFSIFMNILFTFIIILLFLVAIDVLLVSKLEIGPFLAIQTKTYQDGGTKEYTGIGYKVIKYHQTQGRRDTVLGNWSLEYNTDPIMIDDIDLSIEWNDNKEQTYSSYINEYVKINSTLLEVDKENRKITLGYNDDGEKYSLEIICDVVKDQKKFSTLSLGKPATIMGTITDMKDKDETNPNRIYLKNCLVEQ